MCIRDRSRIVKDGDTLDLGGKTLKFIIAPFLHWPDSMFTYLEEDKLLFSCDVFGCHYCEPRIFDKYVSYPQYYEDVYKRQARASCSTTAIELETKEISPNRKLVPIFKMAAVQKVMSRTGISIYVWEAVSYTHLHIRQLIRQPKDKEVRKIGQNKFFIYLHSSIHLSLTFSRCLFCDFASSANFLSALRIEGFSLSSF